MMNMITMILMKEKKKRGITLNSHFTLFPLDDASSQRCSRAFIVLDLGLILRAVAETSSN